jgi:hypothetical protein
LTKRISGKEEEEVLEIAAEYNMDVEWEPVAKCMIKIHVQPRNAEISL